MDDLILIGIGDTAKDIFYFINDYKLYNVLAFAVDDEYKTIDKYLGLPVISIDEIQGNAKYKSSSFFIPIQWNYLNKQRKEMYFRLLNQGLKLVNIISPNAIIRSSVSIGTNCWIADNVIIESDTKIGNNVFIKSNVWISHYVNIDDHCFIGAKSCIAGKVSIGKQCFLGINSTIFDGVQIGNKCIIGACSIIKRHLPSYKILKNNLSNIVEYQSSDEEIESKLVASKNLR